MNRLGWLGSILLAGCGIPEVVNSIQTGTCSLTWTFLLMWLFGEIFVLIPVLFRIRSTFLIFNYSLNIICILILIGFKV